jgi:hypothetical protein
METQENKDTVVSGEVQVPTPAEAEQQELFESIKQLGREVSCLSSVVQNFGYLPTKEELAEWLDSVDKYMTKLSDLADTVKAWVGDRVRT